MKKIVKNLKKFNIVLIFLILICAIYFGIKTQGKKVSIPATQIESLNENDEIIGEKGYISSAVITQRKTGTGPFDSNDEAGNDSSEDNNIVRSFDQITWTIENTIKLKNEQSGESYKGGIIHLRAEIPEIDSNYVQWDLESMKWAENAELSDNGKTFTADYSLSTSEVTLPGKQTLVLVLKVLGAPNGIEINPQFSIKLEGNEESEKFILNDSSIRVSAAPNYNIKLCRNTSLAQKVTVDYGEGETRGRMYGFSFVLQLCNLDENKGLKGIEYPKEEIDFNINAKLIRTKFSSTEEEDITDECTPVLWNYKLNNTNNYGIIEDRTMIFNSETDKYNNIEPYGIIKSDRSKSVYNSGNITMSQDGNMIHTKISNYGFDGIFPQYSMHATKTTPPIYKSNEGCFNVSYFQIFVPDNEASTIEERNYYLEISDSNLKMTSISGVLQENQQITTDDTLRHQHVINNKGVYYHNMFLSKDNGGGYLTRDLRSGDAKAILGQYFEIYSKFNMNVSNDNDVNSATKFIKFDGSCVEPKLYDNGDKYKKENFDGNMTFKIWYITKQDGTNWIDQHEMNQAKIEEMLYYEKIEDIPNGYICVGEYIESISGNITASSGGNNTVRIRLRVKDSAEIGKTYGFTQTTTDWIEYVDRENYSIIKNNFSEWPNCTWTSGEIEYIKTEYDENGEIVTGTHSGGPAWGQSILIVGADLQLSKEAINEDGEKKVNYDFGKNENNVKYRLTPQIVNNLSTDIEIENVNLKVEDILPKGINYIPGSSNYGEPTIIENNDETTTLRWNIYNCKLGEAINPILYKAHINEETQNGMQYTSKAIISEIINEGGKYKVGNSEIENRTAINTIQIINLESYSLFKTTNTPTREINEEIEYKITALNNTDNPVSDFQLLDILPYNGDNRGTYFNGDYTISKIELTQKDKSSNEDLGIQNLRIVTTNDEIVRTNITAKDSDLGQGSIWSEVNSGEVLNREVKGIAILGELLNRGKLELDIFIKPNGNKPLDEYKNSATAQTNVNTEVISTPIIEVKVVKRSLEGKVWFDSNRNGLIDENETFLKDEEISLVNEDGTVAKNIDNEEITSVKTDENGYYKFENMKKGNYKVKIVYNNLEQNKEITLKNVGINPEINSKFNADGITDLITTLNNTDSPKEEVKYINAGISFKEARVVVHHYLEGTTTPVVLKDGSGAEEQIITGQVNDDYNTSIADIPEYYELAKTPLNAKGKMQVNDIEVIYYYKIKKYPYTVKYVDKETGQDILQPKENTQLEYGTIIRAEAEKINIEKYTYDSADKETLTINTENNQLVLYYVKKTGTVTAKYIDINTNREIEQQEQSTGKVDSNYITTKKTIPGYTFVEDSNNTTGKYTETPINVNYYYKKNTKVTVNHIDKITGEILNTSTENGLVGDEYTATSRNFDKYILTEKPSQETVTMTQEEIVLNYYYIHVSGGVIEKHIDIITGEILDNTEHTGKEGDEYNILPKSFEGYDLVEERMPENARGTMSKDSKAIEVIYYYRYKSKVIAKYIDKNTGLELIKEISQQGYESEQYTTENKTFENYNLVSLPENAKGVLTKQTIIVTYYYVHVSSGIVVNHFDVNTGEKLKDEERIGGNEGDPYETNIEEFEGYDIVEERLPNNSKGKMKKEEILVNYYYKHRSKVIIKYVDKITNEEIGTEDIINGYEADEYKTQPKEIDGYKFIGEIPDNAEGNMKKYEIEIIYYYKRIAKVIVNYIDIDTNQKILEDVIIEGKQDDIYKTEEKEIKKYKLLKEKYPDNSEGKMIITIDTNEKGEKIINNTTYVKYYYKKLESNLKVKKEIINIIVDGEKQNKQSKLEKVEINRKHILDTTIQVIYRIIVENTGEVVTSATLEEIIPDGMVMTNENNIEWTKNDKKAIINIDSIKPQEAREYQVTLDWISNESNMGTLKNQVQLINVKNEYNIQENNIQDNNDSADIIISIGTGIQKYIVLTSISGILLFIICGYIVKKVI